MTSSTPSTTPPPSVHDLAAGTPRDSVTMPQPKSQWQTRSALPAGLVVLLLALLGAASWNRIMPATDVRVVPVVIKNVQGQSIGSVTVQAPGWLEPDPHPTYVSALTEGVVDEIKVLEGQRVEAGQVVATLIDDDARLGLAQADAELAQRRSDVEAAQATHHAALQNLEHLIAPRQMLAVAEARITETDAAIAQNKADVNAARATLEETRDEYARKAPLIDSGAVSEALVRRLDLRVQSQEAALQAIEAQLDVLTAQRHRFQADLEAARENLELRITEQRDVELAQAAVGRARAALAMAQAKRDEAALRLDRMDVRSPVAGVVMIRLASPGSKLVFGGEMHSAHVVHLYDPAHMQVRVDVPLADAASVGVGQPAEVIVEVLPDHTFTGTVTRVVHEADIAKNTVEVKVAIDNPSEALKPEMLARVRFRAMRTPENTTSQTSLRQRTFAPTQFLINVSDATAQALVVTDLSGQRGRAELRTLELGASQIDGWREVTSGLQPGDLIVANAPASLGDGDRIRVLGESNTTPAGGS
jgi:HlyD family secretion protein